MRVSLFATCLGDRFFQDAAADTVRLLRSLGVEVEVPPGQTCCGQPPYNAGHLGPARRLAEHTGEVFAASDYVVLPSGSCTAMIRKHYDELSGPEEQGRGTPSRDPGALGASGPRRSLPRRTFELAEFLVRVLDVTELGRGLEGLRLAYHHGCHALRELGVSEAPLLLLRNAGAEVVPWEASTECCGFGGLFAVKMPAVSVGMADRKLDKLPDVDVVVSADGGCLMHMNGRARRRGREARFLHLASLLWEARRGGGGVP